MEQQKIEARKAWVGSGETQTDKIWFKLSEKIKPTEFLGYETETVEGEILAIVAEGQEVKKLIKGAKAGLLLIRLHSMQNQVAKLVILGN